MALLSPVVLSLLALAPASASSPSEPARREIVRAIEDLEKAWFSVYETHDLAILERLMADDFVATLADGEVRDKRKHIAAYPADFEALASVTNSDLRVLVYGPDVAVATGLYTAAPRGKGPAGRYRYTDTWLRRNGSWQCIATHENRLE